MDPRRWERVLASFDELVSLDAEERARRLASIGDESLRADVERLLRADADADARLADVERALAGPSAPGDPSAGAASPPDPFGLAGRALAHFRVLEPLGAGGMGVVYRAEDVRLRRTVALKLLLPHHGLDAGARARFLHEARSAAMLEHPNICAVHEVGESEDGIPFLAMPCYAGEALRTRLAREGALPVGRALDIATQTARGLARAHASGIVHRDLKPANLMLLPDGTVRILDFGLAKARDVSLTGSGGPMGTIAYMAPEQLRGERVDARANLWSLGIILGEMLAGRHPLAGEPAAAALHGDASERASRALPPRVPREVARVVERLLRADPAARHASADELLADLAALGAGGALPAPRARAPRSLVRSRTGWAVAAAALVLATGGALWSVAARETTRAQPAPTQPPAAEPSLAVLPLRNYSGDTAQGYFADAMTDELTSTLSKIEGLRVIAHQSVLQFRNSDRSAPEIARALGVRHLVDGSVMLGGDRIRITASLVDAERNAPVWSERFERERRDVLALQREVALAIAREVAVALTPRDLTRLDDTSRVDPVAFDLYVKGTQRRYLVATGEDTADAARYFSRAIATDSGFAPAWAGLASIHVFGGDEARAGALAERALALDPSLAEAHVVLGMIRQHYDWDWTGAERSFREAIRLNPGYAEAHHELSMLLLRLRRFDEALRSAQRALYLAPASQRFENGVGEVHLHAGHADEPLAIAAKLLAADSTWFPAYYLRAGAYDLMGRQAEAVEAMRACIRIAPRGCDAGSARLGYHLARMGRREEALKIVGELRARWRRRTGGMDAYGAAMSLAAVYAGLGDRDRALDWLERAVGNDIFAVYLTTDPAYRSLHGEPRFQALVRRMGLAR